MFDSVKRLFSGWRVTRSLDAGSGAARLSSAGRIDNLNRDLLTSGATIQARAAYLARNNAHIAAAVTALVSNIVGPGITPSSQHPDPETRERLQTLWRAWVDEADFDGAGDFYALQALMVRQMVELGESFVRFVITNDPGVSGVPLRLQALHPQQVPHDQMAALSGQCRAGIEFDDTGRRVAFQVLRHRLNDPASPLFAAPWSFARVPVEDMAHLFNPLEPGQLRGLSWLAPVLLMVHEVDQYLDAALFKAKLANLVCGAMTDPEGNGGGLNGKRTGGQLVAGLEPGTIIPTPNGYGIEFFDPKESAHFPAFVKTHLMAIAAGLGIPYEVLTGDLEGVTYSSIRAGLIEFAKRLEVWQHNVVAFRLCRPVWDRFIHAGVIAGQIDALAYEANPRAFHAVEWLPPRAPWVDPKKDAEAEILAIGAGLKSRTQAVAERGYDIEMVDRERAAERERAARLGLPLDDQTAPVSANQEAA